MTAPLVGSLAYVGVTSPRFEEWLSFGPEILGLEVAGRGPDGAVRLRMDEAARRIAVHPGPKDDLAYLGWAVAGESALEAAIHALARAGIDVQRGDSALAELRGTAEVAWFEGPFGFRHELSFGLEAGKTPFRPGRSMSGFVTGAGGLGHVVLFVPDLARAEQFYIETLGFRLSDRIHARGMTLRFLHCNPRHHTIALASTPGIVGMHHLMLEVASMDDVGTALDLCRARGLVLSMDLGRHTNDGMTSFYVRTPSGFEIEYGWGGRLVEDEASWQVRDYDATSFWGHNPPAAPLAPGVMRPFAREPARR